MVAMQEHQVPVIDLVGGFKVLSEFDQHGNPDRVDLPSNAIAHVCEPQLRHEHGRYYA